MTRYECSGCGLRSCDGRCFDECPADYPDDDEGTPLPSLAELIAKHGSQLTRVDGDPFLKHNRRAA